MKRTLSVCLILCMILSVFAPAASAAEDSTAANAGDTANMSILQKAVVETALAYYYKGNAVQYDSYYLGAGARYNSAVLRETNNRQPEDSSTDDTHYTVCSAFPHDTYFSAFDEHIIDTQRQIAIEGETQAFIPYNQGMGLTEDELAYEYGIQNVTAGYIAMGRLYDKTGENPGNMVVGYWGPNASSTATTCSSADWKAVQAMMQPGDVIAARPLSASSSGDDSSSDEGGGSTGSLSYTGGHTMMFLGDIFGDGQDYVIHSNGGKYNNENITSAPLYSTETDENGKQLALTGFDILEAPSSWDRGSSKNYNRNGSINVAPYEHLLGDGASFDITDCYDFCILRPVNAVTEADLTPSARFRLNRPGLAITKTADVKPYRDVKAGDTITYSVEIENNTVDTKNKSVIGQGYGAVAVYNRNKTYTDLKLTETLPAGTTLVSATGGYTEANGVLTWDVSSLAPEAAATFTYTVRVTGNTEQIVSPAGAVTATGTVGSLQTKELTHEVVTQQLDADAVAAITASSVTASTAATRSGTDVAEDVYAALGYDVQIPGGQQIVDMICQEVPFIKDATTRFQTDFQLMETENIQSAEGKALREMVVPGFVGGQRLYTADENGVRTNLNRLRVLSEDFLQPGDVLVFMNGGRSASGVFVRATKIVSEDAYVYLGNSNWAHYVDGVFTVTNDPVITYYGHTLEAYGIMTTNDIGSDTTGAPHGSRKYSHSKILYQAFLQDLFVLLRPSRVGLTTADAATATAKAVEVQSASGSTWYADLKSALTAAANGDTIVLHEDVQLSSKLTNAKSVTIDFNGHTIASTAKSAADTLFFNLCTVTLKNGTVDGVIYSGSSGVLYLENMTLLGRNWTYTQSSITRKGSALVFSTSSHITLKNVTIASKSPAYVPIQAGNDCTNYAGVTVEDDLKVLIPSGATWNYSTMNLAEGVEAYVGTTARSLDGLTQASKAGVSYTCVTFTAHPDVYNETTGQYYASLTEAAKAASSGDTLRLMRDVDASDLDEVAQNYDSSTGAAKYLVSLYKDLTVEMDGHTITDEQMTSGTFILRDDSNTSGISTVTFRGGAVNSATTAFNCGQLVLEDMEVFAGSCGVFASGSGANGQTVQIKNSSIISGFGGSTGSTISCIRGTATVQDSVLVSNASETLQIGASDNTGSVILENATLAAHMYTYNSAGTAKIANGSVTAAEGYKLTATRQEKTVTVDGKEMTFLADVYGITDPAATINGKSYASVEQALEDAKSGDTAALAANAALAGNVTVPEGVTLDAGDYTLTLAEGAVLTVAGTVTAGENGNVSAAAGQVKLEGEGSYLGITIPKGVAGTVYADPALTAGYTITAGSTLEIRGSTGAGYGAMKAIRAEDGSVLAEDITTDFTLGTQAAKEMNTTYRIILTAAAEDGTYVGGVTEVCIRSCVEDALAKIDWNNETSAAVGRALAALLNYGAAAQTYFGYETNELANRNIGQYSQYLTETITESVLTENRVDASLLSGRKNLLFGSSCLLGEDLQMKLYFAVPTGTEGLTFDVRYGTESMTGLTSGDLTAAESNSTTADYYSLSLSGLTLRDFAEEVTVTVYQNGKALTTGTDSVRSYLARLHAQGGNDAVLADAILTYALAVKEIGS